MQRDFLPTALHALLEKLHVRRLYIGGLATDYCVRDTVLAARERGFDVVVLSDAIHGINAKPGDETQALQEMIEHGTVLHERSHPEQSIR